ncbi:MAG: alpha/beta fold hydrolase [Roseiflexaceae bacterium]
MTTTWQSGFVQSGSVKIRYQRAGRGNSFVMAHGFSDNGDCWKAWAERHFVADYDVVLLDARNHGQSDRTELYNGGIDRAEDTKALITQLNLHKPFLIGHSMGADMALHAATMYPELLRAVILEDPPMWGVPAVPVSDAERQANIDRFVQWLSDMKALSTPDLILRCIRDNPTWRSEEIEAWVRSKQEFGVFGNPSQDRSQPWQTLCAQVGVPTLLVCSDEQKGSIAPAQSVAQARAASAHIEVAHIRNAGHCIRREAPDAFTAVVREFLQRH